VTPRRARHSAAAIVLGLGLAALGVFLWRQGLERADQWSSILSMFLGTISLLVSIGAMWSARHSVRPSAEQRTVEVQPDEVKSRESLTRDGSRHKIDIDRAGQVSIGDGLKVSAIFNYGAQPAEPTEEPADADEPRLAGPERSNRAQSPRPPD